MIYLSALLKAAAQVPQLEIYLGVSRKGEAWVQDRGYLDDKPIIIESGEINHEGCFRMEFHHFSGELQRIVKKTWGIDGSVSKWEVDPEVYTPRKTS